MYTNDTNNNINNRIIYKELSYKIVGILYKIHNEQGRYKNEQIYCDRFEKLLKEEGINYKREYNMPITFKGERAGRNRPDFIIEDKIIIDFKAKTMITKDDYFQMLRYLTSAKMRVGIIVNFRQKFLKPKRIINPEIN